MTEGWIKLYRQFTEWEWYSDANTMRLFLHCILLANHKNKKWQGRTIERGSFITSQSILAHSLKLTVRQIRTALDKLKMTGELTVKTTADYSIITVNNYNLFQIDDRLNDSLMTGYRQSNDSLMTTTNNDKNDKNDKNEKNEKNERILDTSTSTSNNNEENFKF